MRKVHTALSGQSVSVLTDNGITSVELIIDGVSISLDADTAHNLASDLRDGVFEVDADNERREWHAKGESCDLCNNILSDGQDVDCPYYDGEPDR